MAGFNTDGQYGFGKLSGTKKDFNGNHWGWYMGNPDGDTLMMIALGANQNPYDNNALPKYLEDEWSDQNIYWMSPNLPKGSRDYRRIDCKYSPSEIDSFAQAHYDKAKEIFPNAEHFMISGYSAGGYVMPGLAKSIKQDNKDIVGIFGADCIPKDKMYQPFVDMMKDAKEHGIPTFLASSSSDPKPAKSKGRIEQRTEYERQQNPDLADDFESYAGKGVNHGNICKNEAFKKAVTGRVSKWLSPYVHKDGLHMAKDGQFDIQNFAEYQVPASGPAPKQLKPMEQNKVTEIPKPIEKSKPVSKVLTAPKTEQKMNDFKKPSVVKETGKGVETKGFVKKPEVKPAEKPKATRPLPDLSGLKLPSNKVRALEF